MLLIVANDDEHDMHVVTHGPYPDSSQSGIILIFYLAFDCRNRGG